MKITLIRISLNFYVLVHIKMFNKYLPYPPSTKKKIRHFQCIYLHFKLKNLIQWEITHLCCFIFGFLIRFFISAGNSIIYNIYNFKLADFLMIFKITSKWIYTKYTLFGYACTLVQKKMANGLICSKSSNPLIQEINYFMLIDNHVSYICDFFLNFAYKHYNIYTYLFCPKYIDDFYIKYLLILIRHLLLRLPVYLSL